MAASKQQRLSKLLFKATLGGVPVLVVIDQNNRHLPSGRSVSNKREGKAQNLRNYGCLCGFFNAAGVGIALSLRLVLV